MYSMKIVILLHSISWKDSKRCWDTTMPELIYTKDESKCGFAFAFIFGVNWLWRCGVTASFGVFFHEIKCNGITSFMEFMLRELLNSPSKNMASPCCLAGKLATHTTTITIVLVYEWVFPLMGFVVLAPGKLNSSIETFRLLYFRKYLININQTYHRLSYYIRDTITASIFQTIRAKCF